MSHEIRAMYDATTITVYQAYSASIAGPAIKHQRLSASPDFIIGRMTWIKPSWCWMMYRAGYSYKDARQERILAIKVTRAYFEKLLSTTVLAHDRSAVGKDGNHVRVQWDPERNARLERLQERSIQIGIPRGLCEEWIRDGIVAIEDVTERARGLKRTLQEEPNISEQELARRDFLPCEEIYQLPEQIARIAGAGRGDTPTMSVVSQ